MKFDLVKNGNHFVPCDQSDMVKCMKISQGEVIRCQSVDQRNYKHHKKFFAMIRFAFHHLPERFDGQFVDEDDLREELLKAIGWKRTYTNFKGELQERAKSISYDSVGQERFEKIYSRVLDVVARLVEIDSEQVESELLNFM